MIFNILNSKKTRNKLLIKVKSSLDNLNLGDFYISNKLNFVSSISIKWV